MAITYTSNTLSNIVETPTTLYTVPAATSAIITSMYIANVHASEDAFVDVTIAGVLVGAALSIPNATTLEFVVRPIYLAATETIQLERVTSVGTLNAHASVLEQT